MSISKAIVYLAGLLTVLQLICKLPKEIQSMPSIQDVKDAVAAAAQQVKDAVITAVQTETAQVVAQIQAIPVGTVISQADLDSIVASVTGIGPAATAAIDSISDNDTPAPPPPPPPPPPAG